MRSAPLRAVVAAALAAALAVPGAARASPDPLRYDLRADLAVTAGAAALALGLARLTPARCRVCAPGALDDEGREALVWRHPATARTASDLLANAVVPAAALLNSVLSARAEGEPSAALVDALVIAQAAAVAQGLDALAKDGVARRRPGAGGGNTSFYSGHTSFAFSVAAAAGTVSSLRGYPSAPWVWAAGMTLGTGVAYLRVAGDAHWVTDVAAGAVAGGLVGFAVPWLLHRPRGARLAVLPAPGGLAVRF